MNCYPNNSLNNNNSKKKIQQVVIPKGMLDSSETAVIEINGELHNSPVVIAKKDDYPNDTGTPPIRETNFEMPFSDINNSYNESTTSRTPKEDFMFEPRFNQGIQELTDLDDTEILEREILQRNLEEFQKARRRLLFSTTNLAGTPHLNRNLSKNLHEL